MCQKVHREIILKTIVPNRLVRGLNHNHVQRLNLRKEKNTTEEVVREGEAVALVHVPKIVMRGRRTGTEKGIGVAIDVDTDTRVHQIKAAERLKDQKRLMKEQESQLLVAITKNQKIEIGTVKTKAETRNVIVTGVEIETVIARETEIGTAVKIGTRTKTDELENEVLVVTDIEVITREQNMIQPMLQEMKTKTRIQMARAKSQRTIKPSRHHVHQGNTPTNTMMKNHLQNMKDE